MAENTDLDFLLLIFQADQNFQQRIHILGCYLQPFSLCSRQNIIPVYKFLHGDREQKFQHNKIYVINYYTGGYSHISLFNLCLSAYMVKFALSYPHPTRPCKHASCMDPQSIYTSDKEDNQFAVAGNCNPNTKLMSLRVVS